jgi:hypothetical protein
MNTSRLHFKTWSRRLFTTLMVTGLLVSSLAAAPPPNGPPPKVEVIIQAHNTAAAAAWAQSRGAEVTHELDIINAVAVRMPEPALRGLGRAPGIRIYPNSSVKLTQSSAETVRDEFNAPSYANNDGTQTWLNDWQEWGDDGNHLGGDVTITSNRLQMRGEGNGTARAADLSGSTSATLTFDFISVDNGNDNCVVEVSDSGGSSFIQLEEILPTGTGQTVSKSYELQDYISLTANVVVRFRVSQGFAGPGQYASVDNVQIEYTVDATPTPTPDPTAEPTAEPTPEPTPTSEPTPEPTPEADTGGGTLIEAEQATLYGNFTVGNDASASGGAYIHAPEGSGSFYDGLVPTIEPSSAST